MTNIQNRNIYNFYTLPFAASNFNFLTAARTRTSLTLRLNAAAVLQIYIYFYSDNLRYASQTWALHFSKRALVERENVQRPARFGGINSHTNYNLFCIFIITFTNIFESDSNAFTAYIMMLC